MKQPTPQQALAQCGELVYGREWQTPLAADHKISKSSVRDWANGTNDTFGPGHWFWKEFITNADAQINSLKHAKLIAERFLE